MAFDIISASVNKTTTVQTMAAGDTVLLETGVTVTDSLSSGVITPTIFDSSWGTADIDGAVAGYIPLRFAGAAGEVTTIDIAASGALFGLGGLGAISIGTAGTYSIDNSGQISNAPAFSTGDFPDGIYAGSGGTTLNEGSIEGSYDGVENIATTGTATLNNYGSISGGNDGVADTSGHSAVVNNFGSISGAVGVYADASTSEALTNAGSITGGVVLKGADSSLSDTGTIAGGVSFAANASGAQTALIGATGVLEANASGIALFIAAGGFQVVNSGEISALGTGSTADGVFVSGSGEIRNDGKIEANNIGVYNDATAGTTTITNSGSIWGNVGGVIDTAATGSAYATIYNYGEIGAVTGYNAIYANEYVTETVDNAGTITGKVELDGTACSINDSGKIDGNVDLFGGDALLTISGALDGSATLGVGEGLATVVVTSTGVVVNEQDVPALNVESYKYEIKNSGEIIGLVSLENAGTLINRGSIDSASTGVENSDGRGDVVTLDNYGSISGAFDGVNDNTAHTAIVNNFGSISGGSAGVYADSSTVEAMTNAGSIVGGVVLEAIGSSLTDTGTIQGGVSLAGGTATTTTSATIGAKGVIESSASNHAALYFKSGNFKIVNSGEIMGTSTDSTAGVWVAGNGALVNRGSIDGHGDGVSNSAVAGDSATLTNYGSISGGSDGVSDTGGHTTVVNNFGSISGAVGVYADSSTVEALTNAGSITGGVTLLAAGSSLTDTGTIVGEVLFGATSSAVQTALISKTGVLESKAGYSALFITSGGFQIVNSGEIAALGVGLYASGVNVAGSGAIINNGKIEAAAYGIINYGGSGVTTITNSGSIWGNQGGISDGSAAGDATATIYNYGEIGTAAGDDAIYANASATETVVNAGAITGDVVLEAANSSIFNRGSIDGDVTLDGMFTNQGTVDGNINLEGAYETYHGGLGSLTGVITAAAGGDYLYAGAGDETFNLITAGAAYIRGGTGDDIFNFGGELTAATEVIGGAGDDTVTLDGNYSGAATLTLGATTLQKIDTLELYSGFNYDIVANAHTVAAGAAMTVDGSLLGTSNSLIFDASRDVAGSFDMIGGAGANTFIFSAAGFSASDTVQGGSGASNVLKFSTAGTISASALANVTAVETIDLANGANSLTLTDAMVASANAHSMTVVGGTGADTIDASQVTTSTNRVTLYGGAGADTLIAGGGTDIFKYVAASDSTGPAYDTIENANLTVDRFLIPTNSVSAINTAVTGSLSTTTFNSDLASAIGGQLGARDALLFTASAGSLINDTFLIVNLTATTGYQANSDLVIQLTGQTGTLTTANFT